MGTWTKQKGYPVLTLTKEQGGTVYRVVQVTIHTGCGSVSGNLFANNSNKFGNKVLLYRHTEAICVAINIKSNLTSLVRVTKQDGMFFKEA
jgi:hypothetical protein